MLWTIFMVLTSFFAIIGIMEFIMCIIETISMRTNRSVTAIRLVADLQGEEKNPEFLLSSLTLMAERIAFKNLRTRVVIRDEGVTQETYDRLLDYIKENPNVSFIEKAE